MNTHLCTPFGRRTMFLAVGATLALAACGRSASNSAGSKVPITSIDDLAMISDVVMMGRFSQFDSAIDNPPYEKPTPVVVGTMDVTRAAASGPDVATVVWGKEGGNALGALDLNTTYLIFAARVGPAERELLPDKGDIFLPTQGKRGVFVVEDDHATQLASGFDEPQSDDTTPASRRATTQPLDTLFGVALRNRCTEKPADTSC